MSEDEIAIHQLVDRWMSASRQGDTEILMELMTDDVLFLVPGAAPFGKAEFRAALHAMHGVSIDGHAEIRELHIFEEWAWMRNQIKVEMCSAGTDPVKREGFTLTILRKEQDGRWRVSRDANLVV